MMETLFPIITQSILKTDILKLKEFLQRDGISNYMAWSSCPINQNICGIFHNTNSQFGFQNYKSVFCYTLDNNPKQYSNFFANFNWVERLGWYYIVSSLLGRTIIA